VLREVHAVDDDAVNATLARIWARDERKDDYEALEIDAVLRSRVQSKSLPLLRPQTEAKLLTRRALEVGLYAVLDFRKNSPPDSAGELGRIAKHAATARRATDRLLRVLDSNAKVGADLELAIVTSIAGYQEVEGLDARALHALARKDGECLWGAREAMKRLEDAAYFKGVRIGKARPKSTKPEHAAFAKILAECWIYLTGGSPGVNAEPSKNPFLRFVRSAWIDTFNHGKSGDPEFIGAVRSLNFDGSDIACIVRSGPSWR
jgi:hypothetical protein